MQSCVMCCTCRVVWCVVHAELCDVLYMQSCVVLSVSVEHAELCDVLSVHVV